MIRPWSSRGCATPPAKPGTNWAACRRTSTPGCCARSAPTLRPGLSASQAHLLAAKYPVTNVQFERFIEDGGYEKPIYWDGEESIGWQWRISEHNTGWRGEGPVTQPEYWQHPRFGKDRHGYPVVGVSWYEAAAYAAWLAEWWRTANSKLQVWRNGQLETFNLQIGTFTPRLPTDDEWLRLAGGEKEGKKERYPWDVPGSGRVTEYETEAGKAAILARANTRESGIDGTSPVAMYPLGESKPFGLADVAGNVWEWTDSWYEKEQRARVVRGGSWSNSRELARPSVRHWVSPDYSDCNLGFRLVSPIVLASDFWNPGF